LATFLDTSALQILWWCWTNDSRKEEKHSEKKA